MKGHRWWSSKRLAWLTICIDCSIVRMRHTKRACRG